MTSAAVATAVVVDGAYDLAEGGRRVDDRYVYVDILGGRLFELRDGTGRAARQLARLDVPLGAVAPVPDRSGTWIADTAAVTILRCRAGSVPGDLPGGPETFPQLRDGEGGPDGMTVDYEGCL
ncbi:hypothetical protein OK074_0240 [Actinobacteria bacterium OK074]|nr:hypothetical protein OK074_0240 [Actinobacteria bacterium OK074]